MIQYRKSDGTVKNWHNEEEIEVGKDEIPDMYTLITNGSIY